MKQTFLFFCVILLSTPFVHSQDVLEQNIGISGKGKSYENGTYDPVSYGIFYSKSLNQTINVQGEVEYGWLDEGPPIGSDIERIKEVLLHPSLQYISSRKTAIRFVAQVGPTLGYMDYLDQRSNTNIIGESKGFVVGGNGSAGLRIYLGTNTIFAQPEYNYNVLSNGFTGSNISAKLGFDLFK